MENFKKEMNKYLESKFTKIDKKEHLKEIRFKCIPIADININEKYIKIIIDKFVNDVFYKLGENIIISKANFFISANTQLYRYEYSMNIYIYSSSIEDDEILCIDEPIYFNEKYYLGTFNNIKKEIEILDNKNMQFIKNDKNITIIVPIYLLKFVAENNPESPYIVHDEYQLAEKVLFQLENHLGKMESGLTGFQELLDKAIDEVAEEGHDFIEIKEIK